MLEPRVALGGGTMETADLGHLSLLWEVSQHQIVASASRREPCDEQHCCCRDGLAHGTLSS